MIIMDPDALEKLRQSLAETRDLFDKKNDTWWDELSQDDRESAFYAVCKRIHKADIEDRGSYRYGLYDVFNFDAGMYEIGMQCGYLDIHNSICDGLEHDEESKQITKE